MKDTSDKQKVLLNLVWKFFERSGTRGVQVVVQIFLARLLAPKDYGIISLISIFISIANELIQSGLDSALIQKKTVDETDLSSVFYLNLVVAAFLYLLLYIASPTIAAFFNEPRLINVLRILALTLFASAFNSIQNAIVARTLQFKMLFYSSVGSSLVSGIVGIWMAYKGFGVWALVFQSLASQFGIALILWLSIRWRPKVSFSLHRIKALYAFGWKILVSSLLNAAYGEIRSLVIGKMYSAEMLGYYTRGRQFPQIIINNINGSIQSVMLPVLSSHQDSVSRVKAIVRKSISTSSIIIFPMMIGLAVVSEAMVELVLTEKWLPAVPFLQVFCMIYMLWPIHTANLQAINAIGRSDIFLKLEMLKKVIGISILVITIPHGVYVIALGELISGSVSAVLNAFPNIKLLNYSIGEQLKDTVPSLLLALLMGAILYFFRYLGLSAGITLLLQVSAGVAIYIGLAFLFKIQSLNYVLSTFKEMIHIKR
jgi:O-antigen/teichoic acid export membrane protein